MSDFYLNFAITLFTSESGLAHASPDFTVLPQYPQVAPSLFRKGLCEAHVPLNSPFFTKINLTDIRTKKMATIPIPSNTVSIAVIWVKNSEYLPG